MNELTKTSLKQSNAQRKGGHLKNYTINGGKKARGNATRGLCLKLRSFREREEAVFMELSQFPTPPPRQSIPSNQTKRNFQNWPFQILSRTFFFHLSPFSICRRGKKGYQPPIFYGKMKYYNEKKWQRWKMSAIKRDFWLSSTSEVLGFLTGLQAEKSGREVSVPDPNSYNWRNLKLESRSLLHLLFGMEFLPTSKMLTFSILCFSFFLILVASSG